MHTKPAISSVRSEMLACAPESRCRKRRTETRTERKSSANAHTVGSEVQMTPASRSKPQSSNSIFTPFSACTRHDSTRHACERANPRKDNVHGQSPTLLAHARELRGAGTHSATKRWGKRSSFYGPPYRLCALNVEKMEENALVRTKRASKADVRKQRVGNLPGRACHTYPDHSGHAWSLGSLIRSGGRWSMRRLDKVYVRARVFRSTQRSVVMKLQHTTWYVLFIMCSHSPLRLVRHHQTSILRAPGHVIT
jgi:hypothetical protein